MSLTEAHSRQDAVPSSLGAWIIVSFCSRLGNWTQEMASVPQVLILLPQSFPHIWHPISLSFIQLIVRELWDLGTGCIGTIKAE